MQATPDDPIFLDCDADAFGVLLSHMRVPSCVLLPPGDVGLATRVLLLAEYLGLDGFLTAIKARAYSHMHSCSTATDAAAATAFDEEAGGLQQAIDKRLLPARFFAPEPPPPPPPPEATVPQQLLAALLAFLFLTAGGISLLGDRSDAHPGGRLHRNLRRRRDRPRRRSPAGSPHTSPHLPRSPPISPDLPISPAAGALGAPRGLARSGAAG